MRNNASEYNILGMTTKKTHVDIAKIYNGEVSRINLDFGLDIEEDLTYGFEFEEPVNVKACVYEEAQGKNMAESLIMLSIDLEGEYTCACARCAKELKKTLSVSEKYGVTRNLSDDDEEYIEAPGGILDVKDAARTLFYLNLPQRVLCKDTCQGLCPVCGTDLNGNTCSCKMPERGNRLTGLKKLLDNYQEK